MKECSSCNEVKELDEFSAQKTKPNKTYAWCDPCREANKKPVRRLDSAYLKEMRELKQKAKELRRFSPEQAAMLKERYFNGEKVKDLAKEMGTSTGPVYNAIKDYGNMSLKPALKPNPFEDASTA